MPKHLALLDPTAFQLSATVQIRPCHAADVRNLEWFGALTQYRHVIERAFTRQQMGDVVMLNAMLNDFPIGQVWIDLHKQRAQQCGVLWALRVLPPLQNLGVGSRLIDTAEMLLREHGFIAAELDVERDNIAAQRLYMRLGYASIGEFENRWHYIQPATETAAEKQTEVVSHELRMTKRL